jgi:plastocyanin
MTAETACVAAHAGKPVYDEPVVTGKAGEIANVFVYVKTGLEGKKFEPPKTAVVIEQHGCMFVPRVMGILSGQTLAVKNTDNVSHNINPMPKENREWNQQQSPGAPDIERRFARPEIMIPVKCNVHKWMRSYIGVLDHPYFAVTSSDGSFELKNLPPGDYTVAVWHEQLGGKTQEIHMAASASTEMKVTLE